MSLIKCPTCQKEISENVKNCPKCYEPINEEDLKITVAYVYNGKPLNSPLFPTKLEYIKEIRSIGKVSLYDEDYIIQDCIYNVHKDIITFILSK